MTPAARELAVESTTVPGDAGYAVHEPVDVHHAGRSYQYGLASCRGAFHPKPVILGEDQMWVATGSANPCSCRDADVDRLHGRQ